jgi:N-methylhydantoinase B/oxoprolinase/acetone carboxylase alpha subunit
LTTKVTAVASTAFGTDLKETKSSDREEHLPSKIPHRRTKARDIVRTVSPCGGGYGDPLARDPRRVLDDVLDGFVSEKNAREQYGVVVKDGEVDSKSTERLRAEMRRSGPDAPWSSSSPSSDSRTCPDRKSRGGKV